MKTHWDFFGFFFFFFFFFWKYNILLHLDIILILLFLTVISFSQSIIIFACSLKEVQNFFKQSFPQYKVSFSAMWLNPQIVDIEYPQGVCYSMFVFEDFSGLFAHSSIFLLEI